MVLGWHKIAGVLFFLLIPQYSLAVAEYDSAWNLKGWEIKRINDGRIITHTFTVEGHTKQVDAFLLIKTPAEFIFSMITDYERLPGYMPNLERVEVLEASTAGALVNYELAFPFGLKKRYRLKLDYYMENGELGMTWDLAPWQGLTAEESLRASTGFLRLKETEDTNVTLLVYDTKTDPGYIPFGLGWIVNYLTDRIVIEFLEETKQRAERKWVETKEVNLEVEF